MPQLELTVTEGIDRQRAEKLAGELRDHLKVAEHCTFVRRFFDPVGPAVPQYIQLIGDAALWLVLLASAKWFLKPYLECPSSE